MENFMNGMFGKIASGMCRLSMSGEIAVKTSNGYKTYNIKKGRLTNCNNFVFNIGEEFFFLIPTSKAKKGDILLIAGKPKCVVGAKPNEITVINYEDSTMETVIPERHVFMGNTYFYGKIVSLFGNDIGKGKGMDKMMKYMMLSEMMGEKGLTGTGSSSLLPLMLMNSGGFDNMFDGLFETDEMVEDDDEKEEEDE